MPERPVIGLTGGSTLVPIPEGALAAHYVGTAYARAIVAAGGLPLVLPAVEDAPDELAAAYLDRVDGLVLSGGIDIAPSLYGGTWEPEQRPDPARDRFEQALVRLAVERRVPVLGVCRGMQMINVALGGTLHEHVEHAEVRASVSGTFEGVRMHTIPLTEGSLVREVLCRERLGVLCLHHQAPDRVPAQLRIGARADDGIVEAVEGTDGAFLLGVLWHPEHMVDDAPLQGRLYAALVEAARRG
jgi:putative glutamine amidotransferase